MQDQHRCPLNLEVRPVCSTLAHATEPGQRRCSVLFPRGVGVVLCMLKYKSKSTIIFKRKAILLLLVGAMHTLHLYTPCLGLRSITAAAPPAHLAPCRPARPPASPPARCPPAHLPPACLPKLRPPCHFCPVDGAVVAHVRIELPRRDLLVHKCPDPSDACLRGVTAAFGVRK